MKVKKPVFRDLVIIKHNPKYPTEINILGRVYDVFRGSWGEEKLFINYINYNKGYIEHRIGCFGLCDLQKATKQSVLELSKFYKYLSMKYEKTSQAMGRE